MTGSIVLFWMRSHMVNICSTPFLNFVYAWSSRRRFSEVRGMHFHGWDSWTCCISAVSMCVLLSSWSRASVASLRYCCGLGRLCALLRAFIVLLAWSCYSSVISFPLGMRCFLFGFWGLVCRVNGMEATSLYRYLVSGSCIGLLVLNKYLPYVTSFRTTQ